MQQIYTVLIKTFGLATFRGKFEFDKIQTSKMAQNYIFDISEQLKFKSLNNLEDQYFIIVKTTILKSTVYIETLYYISLCSKNFQNVKLRIGFVEIG